MVEYLPTELDNMRAVNTSQLDFLNHDPLGCYTLQYIRELWEANGETLTTGLPSVHRLKNIFGFNIQDIKSNLRNDLILRNPDSTFTDEDVNALLSTMGAFEGALLYWASERFNTSDPDTDFGEIVSKAVWSKWDVTDKPDLTPAEALFFQVLIDTKYAYQFEGSRLSKIFIRESSGGYDLGAPLIERKANTETPIGEIISVHDFFDCPERILSRRESILTAAENIAGFKNAAPFLLFREGYTTAEIAQFMEISEEMVIEMLENNETADAVEMGLDNRSFDRHSKFKLSPQDVFSGLKLGTVFGLLGTITEPLYRKIILHRLGYYAEGQNIADFRSELHISKVTYTDSVQRVLSAIHDISSNGSVEIEEMSLEQIQGVLEEVNGYGQSNKYENGRTALQDNSAEVVFNTEYPPGSLKRREQIVVDELKRYFTEFGVYPSCEYLGKFVGLNSDQANILLLGITDVQDRFSTGDVIINSGDHRHTMIRWRNGSYRPEALCGLSEELQYLFELSTTIEDGYYIPADELARRFTERYSKQHAFLNGHIIECIVSEETALKYKQVAGYIETVIEEIPAGSNQQKLMMNVLLNSIRNGRSLVMGGLQRLAAENGFNESEFINLYYGIERRLFDSAGEISEPASVDPAILEYSDRYQYEPHPEILNINMAAVGESGRIFIQRIAEGLYPTASLSRKERAIIQAHIDFIHSQKRFPKSSEAAQILNVKQTQINDNISVLSRRDLEEPRFADSKTIISASDRRYYLIKLIRGGIDDEKLQYLTNAQRYALQILTEQDNGFYLSEDDIRLKWTAHSGTMLNRHNKVTQLISTLS